MSEIRKRPQVIRDLIDIATYLPENKLENSDRATSDEVCARSGRQSFLTQGVCLGDRI
jgi:hypothetical protein